MCSRHVFQLIQSAPKQLVDALRGAADEGLGVVEVTDSTTLPSPNATASTPPMAASSRPRTRTPIYRRCSARSSVGVSLGDDRAAELEVLIWSASAVPSW
jgi:hypothetical protein